MDHVICLGVVGIGKSGCRAEQQASLFKISAAGADKQEDKNELLKDYEKHLDEFKSSHMVVMIQDLECWLLLYFNKYNNTETINNAEDKVKQYMEIKGKIGKPLVTQALLKKPDFWDRLIKYKDKNKSFRDFLCRVDPNL